MPKIEGYWDCSYCGNKGIRGSVRTCPDCGKTRAADVKFYMLDKEPVADEAAVEAGPDWFCPYCDSYNPSSAPACTCCGHPREENDKDYFEVRKDEEEKQQEADAAFAAVTAPSAGADQQTATRSRVMSRRIISVVLILAVLFAGFWLLSPKNRSVTVTDMSWERSVEVQENRLVEESGWAMPADAVELIRSAREIHHYDQILDHYETVSVERSRQVLDGYDTYTTYEDMGNGYFQSVEHETPRYRTEYYTETYEEPVYVSVPVYDTKYYYTVYRWEYDRTETAAGTTDPYWPELQLMDSEREGNRSESYAVVCEDGKGRETEYACDYDIWSAMTIGRSYDIQVQSGQILAIK